MDFSSLVIFLSLMSRSALSTIFSRSNPTRLYSLSLPYESLVVSYLRKKLPCRIHYLIGMHYLVEVHCLVEVQYLTEVRYLTEVYCLVKVQHLAEVYYLLKVKYL